MKTTTALGRRVTIGLVLVATTHADRVLAEKGTPQKTSTHAVGAPVTRKAIKLTIPGIVWGMSSKQVAARIDELLQDDYRPLYAGAQPGEETKVDLLRTNK